MDLLYDVYKMQFYLLLIIVHNVLCLKMVDIVL